MVPAVRPLGPLSMARGCARIDSRPDTAKIGSADRVEVHHARLLAVIGVRKTFPHGLDPKRKLAILDRVGDRGELGFEFRKHLSHRNLVGCPSQHHASSPLTTRRALGQRHYSSPRACPATTDINLLSASLNPWGEVALPTPQRNI